MEHSRLNTVWTRDALKPDVNNHPHFTSSATALHLFRTTDGLWIIARDIDGAFPKDAYAIARSGALHPNTIRNGEWNLPAATGWHPCRNFKTSTEGTSSENAPFDLFDDLGGDFFVRVHSTKAVWFKDPSTGDIMHSGAKAAGLTRKPGKRYCPQCAQCFSANNFVSQHVRNLHTPTAPTPPQVAADGTGGVRLQWRIEGCAEAAQPVSYAVQSSTDGGHTWTTEVEDTKSIEPRAHIMVLEKCRTYMFRIAAYSIATLGPWSEPSAVVQPEQPTAVVPILASATTVTCPGDICSLVWDDACSPCKAPDSAPGTMTTLSSPTPPCSPELYLSSTVRLALPLAPPPPSQSGVKRGREDDEGEPMDGIVAHPKRILLMRWNAGHVQ